MNRLFLAFSGFMFFFVVQKLPLEIEYLWRIVEYKPVILTVLFSWSILQYIPKDRIIEISLFTLIIIYEIFELLFFASYHLDFISFKQVNFIYPVFAISSVIFLYKLITRAYSHESDIINPENICICLWKPGKPISVFTSLIGSPYAGINIYADNHLYGFKWSEEKYLKRNVSTRAVQKSFVIIDTGMKTEKSHLTFLNGRVGWNARKYGVRSRCTEIIEPLLNTLGPKFKPRKFEKMPSLYALRILKGREHGPKKKYYGTICK